MCSDEKSFSIGLGRSQINGNPRVDAHIEPHFSLNIDVQFKCYLDASFFVTKLFQFLLLFACG